MGVVNISELMLRVCLCDKQEQVLQLSKKWEEEIDIDKLDFRGMRLAPYFYATQKKHGVNTKYEKRLKVLHQYWWLKTNFLQDQLQITCNTLAENNIQPIILKGGSLLHYYDEPVLRPMADIDVLVPYNQIIPAIKKLKLLGYSISPDILPLLSKYPKMYSGFKHSVTLNNKKLNIELDLHWRVGDYLSKNITNSVFAEKIKHPVIKNAFVPKLSHDIIITILHAVLSKSQDNLNWILDIKTLTNKMNPDIWNNVFEIAEKEQKQNLVWEGIQNLKRFDIHINLNNIQKRNSKKIKLCTYDHEIECKENKSKKTIRKIRNTWISVKLIFPNANPGLKCKYFIRFLWFQFILRNNFKR